MSTLEAYHRKLKYDLLNAPVNAGESSNNEISNQLQNDHDAAHLRKMLKDAEDEIGALRLEKASIEADLNAIKRECLQIQSNHDDILKEFHKQEEADAWAHDAEIQLQVLTTEHMATTVQLHAYCDDLTETKAKFDAEQEEHKKEVANLKKKRIITIHVFNIYLV